MDRLIRKYADKLVTQGLCEPGAPLICGLDAELTWNRQGSEIPVLSDAVAKLPINSLLFAEPAEPYRSIINYLAEHSRETQGIIKPEDSETRTFLHDIPVAGALKASTVVELLNRRKAIIIKNSGIISFGIVSPEQAFIHYSSVCFSCFVKFFVDIYYKKLNQQAITKKEENILIKSAETYKEFISTYKSVPSFQGPFEDPSGVIAALTEAGRMTVESRMVDSFFGNISCKYNDIIYISQTGSSLDELAGYIDPCPVDNSSTVAITASSEFKAHKSIYGLSDCRTILHGHPKFSVIMSMICDKPSCDRRGKCHTECREKRFAGTVPIVSGEVGTGPTGLYLTLPPAMKEHEAAIVYGHGLFTRGKNDFRDAFKTLVDTEKNCLDYYLSSVRTA